MISAVIGSLFCFILARYFFNAWSLTMWRKNGEKYQRALYYFDRYGVWGIILLRTISFMPSNIVSIMAALSPLTFKQYLWSSLVGNVPMVMLLALLSSPIALTSQENLPLLISFSCTSLLLIGLFLYDQRTGRIDKAKKGTHISLAKKSR